MKQTKSKVKDTLTQTQLKEVLNYNPETGVFIRKTTLNHNKKTGHVVGSINSKDYLLIMVNNNRYLAHRLAWLYVYGEFPKNLLDHINGKRDDNRIVNLRECSYTENTMNTGKRVDNTSGYKGVCWHNGHSKWCAQIQINKKKIHIGYFNTPEEASLAYEDFAQMNHKDFYNQGVN